MLIMCKFTTYVLSLTDKRSDGGLTLVGDILMKAIDNDIDNQQRARVQ